MIYKTSEWRRTAPAALAGTSPKSDDLNFESAFKIFIVVFGGGRVGAEAYLITYSVADCAGRVSVPSDAKVCVPRFSAL